jgi:hypothetical protein
MSKPQKKQKRSKKPKPLSSLTPEKRRKIEESLARQSRPAQPASASSLKPTFDLPSIRKERKTYGDSSIPDELPVGEETDGVDLNAALWVYEASDFDELSIEDVRTIWENRSSLCGSAEAAAEALALLEVGAGVVPSYQGWQKYVSHPEISPFIQSGMQETRSQDELNSKSAFLWKLSALKPNKTPSPKVPLPLTDLSFDELKKLWSEREEAFDFIEEATEAFALLRHKSGIDPELQPAARFTNHPIIQELSDLLPERGNADFSALPAEKTEGNPEITVVQEADFSAFETDKRQKVQRETVLRDGQVSFRKQILEIYNGECCVTGCRETSVLEAAHIVPYMGSHSNTPDNGLCLRVDIHRLFDRYLLSVNPESLVLEIAPSLMADSHYSCLKGIALKSGSVSPRRELLEKHYLSFTKANS